MSDDVTPAIRRLAEKQFRDHDSQYSTDGMVVSDFYGTARTDLAAVLDDLDDLARILRGTDPEVWRTVDPATKARWTVEARRVRTALLGADS